MYSAWIWTVFQRKCKPGSQFMESTDLANLRCHGEKSSRRTSTSWSVGGLFRKQKSQQGTAAFGNTSCCQAAGAVNVWC